MKIQVSQSPSTTSLNAFETSRIDTAQLIEIRGGDGDASQEEGDNVIGVEELVIG